VYTLRQGNDVDHDAHALGTNGLKIATAQLYTQLCNTTAKEKTRSSIVELR